MNETDYQNIIQNVTSEMFLSLMILLQTQLPCTDNFMKYKKNFEDFAGEQQSKDGSTKLKSMSPKNKDQTIASPKHMTKLSPIT